MGSVGAPGIATVALELREVRKRFGGIRAVDGVSLCVQARDRVAVIGPNGAGKSTLFGLISGEQRPDEGEVLLEGRSMRGVSPQRRAELGLGRTFQHAGLAMLLAEQHPGLVGELAGRVYLLERGVIRDAGFASQLPCG